MPPTKPPDTVLRVVGRTQRAARGIQRTYQPRMLAILNRSIASLERRLARLPQDRFVAQQTRSILIQQKAASVVFSRELNKGLRELGTDAAQLGRDALLQQARAWDPVFPGTFRRLVRLEEAEQLLDSVLLRHYRASVTRYGLNQIGRMQVLLAESQLRGETLSQATDRLSTAMQLDKGWSERIVRTETSRAVHRRQLKDLRDVLPDDEHDEWRKQLIAVVPSDGRTHSDSFSVHLQTRKLDEDFEDNEGRKYPHPPNRPNDRETMVLVPAPIT